MPSEEQNRGVPSSHWEQLERKESKLWRYSILLLLLLVTALGYFSWGTIRTLPQHLEALPFGIMVLMALFGAYVWNKKREIAELRGFIRGFQERASSSPSERQVGQLVDILSRSQHGYRELIDSLNDAVFTFSLQGEIQVVNRRFTEMLGLSFSEVVHRPLDEFLSEPTRAQAEQKLTGFLEKRFWSGVLPVRLKRTGEFRYFDCMLHAAVSDGKVIGISGLARDVTEQRESEARFTQLFETLQEGVYFSTPEGRLLDVNPALVRMVGYGSKEELVAVNAYNLYPDPSARDRLLGEVDEKGALYNREITLVRKDGTPIRCLDSCSSIRDASGRVVRYQGTLVDITHRLEIEKNLRLEREFVRRLVDSIPDAIIVLDTQRRYTFVSARIQEISGYAPEDLLGRPMGEHTDPLDERVVTELFESLIAGKAGSGSVEYRTRHKDGNWRIFRANAGPLFDADGRIAGVVASARDVTETKKLEQQLLQAEKLAAMGQMIAGVAHELNNPLTAILGVSDLLRERASDDSMRRQTELVHQQARRAAHIVQSLLTCSRPSAPRRSRIRLPELLRRALQLQEDSLRKHRITVEVLSEPDLPVVMGDPNQLLQVFLNLIVNAEQAIREVRDHGTLRVHLGRIDGKVAVGFEDDGPGIRSDILPSIFDPFFTTKRPGGGTGLGLTICLAIAKEHGGAIDAQSAPSGGARFRVILPVPTSSAAEASLAPAREASAPVPASLRRCSVLVVDDQADICDLIQVGLSAQGITVDCVSSSEEALKRLAGHSYDAVLCDLHLPGLSGERLFEQLRGGEGASARHFVFMTGDLLDSAALESYRKKGVLVVHKPFQISELTAALGELFEPVASKAP